MTHYDGMQEATEAGNESQRAAEAADDRIKIAKMLGWTNIDAGPPLSDVPDEPFWTATDPADGATTELPDFFHDASAAELVVVFMAERGLRSVIRRHRNAANEIVWRVSFWRIQTEEDQLLVGYATGAGPSASPFIVAALQAMDREGRDDE